MEEVVGWAVGELAPSTPPPRLIYTADAFSAT